MDRKRVRIGDTYHQWTRYRRDKMVGGGSMGKSATSIQGVSCPIEANLHILPESTGRKPALGDDCEEASVRDFSHQPITFEELSRLIWAIQGITARAREFEFRTVRLRSPLSH